MSCFLCQESWHLFVVFVGNSPSLWKNMVVNLITTICSATMIPSEGKSWNRWSIFCSINPFRNTIVRKIGRLVRSWLANRTWARNACFSSTRMFKLQSKYTPKSIHLLLSTSFSRFRPSNNAHVFYVPLLAKTAACLCRFWFYAKRFVCLFFWRVWTNLAEHLRKTYNKKTLRHPGWACSTHLPCSRAYLVKTAWTFQRIYAQNG